MGTKSILLIITVALIAFIFNAESAHATQLTCKRFTASLKLTDSLQLTRTSAASFESTSSDSEESSSWVPRIVIPVVAIVVVGTTTYLIFSQRG